MNKNNYNGLKVGYFPFKPGGNPYQSLFAQALEQNNVNVIRIPPKKWLPLTKVKEEPCDLLQFDWPHDWYSGRNIITRQIKRAMYEFGLIGLRSKPLVWTAHNLYAHDAKNISYEKKMIQKLINVCDGVIVLSERSKQQLREHYRVNNNTIVSAIPHGHYIDIYPNDVSRYEARQAFGIEDACKVCLSLGRILPYKGLEELIHSFAMLDINDAVLIIAGACADQQYLETLQNMAKSLVGNNRKIIFRPGFVDENEMQLYFNAADVCAFPFKNILNSGSLLLAMSFGKCVVAPDVGSITEVAHHEGLFAYKPNADEGLSKALISAMKLTEEERSNREKIILDYTIDNFDWKKIGGKVLNLYEQVISCK